jgi:hypothetical protein
MQQIKSIQIWQRDSLSVEINSTTFAKQKLKYIHFNPVGGKWNLAKNYLEYNDSSARFYETFLSYVSLREYFYLPKKIVWTLRPED